MISKESLKFLDDIKKNNNRDWFITQKKRYDAYKQEYHDIVQLFLDVLKPHDERLQHLEVKNCTFRINRDIRFSKNKSPYKTNMAFWFSPGTKNTNLSGYYVHIEKGMSFVAGGVYHPDAADLKKIRKEISFFHDELEEILAHKKFVSFYGALDRNEENSLRTSPKGYEKDHPAIDFLKLKSFTASAQITDKELSDKNFVTNISEKILALRPLTEFLNRAITTEDNGY